MIGNRVKSIREKRNLTISELAKRAKVAKSYISALERNPKVKPQYIVFKQSGSCSSSQNM